MKQNLTTLDHPSSAPSPAASDRRLESVCVYCGSGKGLNPAYAIAARKLGRALAEHDIRLVYGGGSLGLMGEVAKSTLGAGGKVTGIIPEFLGAKEKMLKDVDELIIVDDMHARKKLMFERSDAFVALPGGIGTLEELVEQLTWSQLGQHTKPIVVANIDGFWTPFLDLLAHMKRETFIRSGLDIRFAVVSNAEHILPTLLATAGQQEPAHDQAVIAKF
ncbi:MAG: TIGR00730 family Rossman fold protein [Hyphomicrobium sp.]